MMDSDADYFNVEVVLRSFSIGDEAHFAKQFKEMRSEMKLTPLNNFIEDWEPAAIDGGQLKYKKEARRARIQKGLFPLGGVWLPTTGDK